MEKLSHLAPTEKPRLIDLVKAAGVDTSNWAKNLKRGKKFAGSNPKYCYNWSFVESKKVVVLNFWYRALQPKNGGIVIEGNFQEIDSNKNGKKHLEFHAAIKLAYKEKLPIRIIILIGESPEDFDKVKARKLDEMFWSVTRCSQKDGYVITRNKVENALDDLTYVPVGNDSPDRAKVTSFVIKRDNKVRAFVLKRARGKCEHCGVKGFQMTNGGFYLETHHVIALCHSGKDTVENVLSLCPLHHRQAHYGADAENLEKQFSKKLKKINKHR